MKTKLLTSIGCLLLMAGFAFGQTSQSINLYTHGTTNTSSSVSAGGTFSLDTSVTFTGFTGRGLSYWLEASSALAPYIQISAGGETYSTWTDPNQSDGGFATTFINSSSGVESGFTRENRDLGATSTQDPNTGAFLQDEPAGTYTVSTLTLALSPSTPAGTYFIETTDTSPVPSEINDTSSVAHDVALATYEITVVPEPATLSLFGLGALGSFGLNLWRTRRRA